MVIIEFKWYLISGQVHKYIVKTQVKPIVLRLIANDNSIYFHQCEISFDWLYQIILFPLFIKLWVYDIPMCFCVEYVMYCTVV